jgi:heat-inducible transcriptional repressor
VSRLPEDLSPRERVILRSIIYNYILTANPVGSRSLARRFQMGLSPATVRNTMADLEEMGLLSHPHTSAGRVPTDLGYRLYVDDLMRVEELPDEIRRTIDRQIETVSPEMTDLYQNISELLADVSKLLAVISAPNHSTGTLDKVELVRVATGRIMVVVVVASGLVRTIMLEINSAISDGEIADAAYLINSRLAGMKLADIPRGITERLGGDPTARNAIVRMFLEFPERIFALDPRTEVHVGGARHVIDQPEYSSPDRLKGIIELLDNSDIVVHLLKDRKPGVSVTIGEENPSGQLREISVITSTYRVGDASGTLGIIGPTRMNYARLMALVDYTALMVGEKISGGRLS